QVPKDVRAGAARFVATVTDGGIVETEVKPFVVPTGVLHIAAYPEGGELVAGVVNRVYFEVTDALGRPADTTLQLVDGSEQRLATAVTEHQGRARLSFLPEAGASYRVRALGQQAAADLPAVREHGIALQSDGDGIAAGAPLGLRLCGRGEGPW